MGPFPVVDEYRNECIITDWFSHFVMLYATENATAISAAKGLLRRIGMFGMPMYIYCRIMDHNMSINSLWS